MVSVLFRFALVLGVGSFVFFLFTITQQQIAVNFLTAAIILFFLSFVLSNIHSTIER